MHNSTQQLHIQAVYFRAPSHASHRVVRNQGAAIPSCRLCCLGKRGRCTGGLISFCLLINTHGGQSVVDQYADYREAIVISDQLFRGLHHSRGEHHMQQLLKPALPALLCAGMSCRTRNTLTGTLSSFSGSYALVGSPNVPHEQRQVWEICAWRGITLVMCDPRRGWDVSIHASPLAWWNGFHWTHESVLSIQMYMCIKGILLSFSILWVTDGRTDGRKSPVSLQGWSRRNLMISFFSPECS